MVWMRPPSAHAWWLWTDTPAVRANAAWRPESSACGGMGPRIRPCPCLPGYKRPTEHLVSIWRCYRAGTGSSKFLCTYLNDRLVPRLSVVDRLGS